MRPKPRDLPRLGPLAEPSLVDRLRASWSLADLVPSFDPRTFTKREWRRAAAGAVAFHAVFLTAVIVASQLGYDPSGRVAPKISWVNTPSMTDVANPPPPPGGGDAGGGDAGGGTPAEGGSNTAPAPVTRGAIPPSRPLPAIIPPNLPPTVAQPVLPVDASVAGPAIDVPAPLGPAGLPDAPPGPPSAGDAGGTGVGKGPGDGGGDNIGSGRGGGGGPGPGSRDGRLGPSTEPGAGAGTGPGIGTPPVRNRPLGFASKARPVATAAMIEANTTGTVTFEVTVGPNGALLNFRPIQTLANGGTEAAITALKRCRFRPAIRNGQYVTETAIVSFTVRSR